MSMSCISQYDSCYHTWVTKTCISQDFFFVCVICRIILLLQQGFSLICWNGCQCTGSCLGMGTAFAGVGISVVERGWSWDNLIFVMGFPTPMGQDFYIEMGPWSLIPVLYMYGAYLYSALFCFSSHPNKLYSITEIGAHKLLLPAPFAMDSLSLCEVLWSVCYLWNNWSLVMFLVHFVCCNSWQ